MVRRRLAAQIAGIEEFLLDMVHRRTLFLSHRLPTQFTFTATLLHATAAAAFMHLPCRVQAVGPTSPHLMAVESRFTVSKVAQALQQEPMPMERSNTAIFCS